MEILPSVAGRVVSLKVGNHELVIPHIPDRPKDSGTVLWSSPQAEWNWPPIDVLDSLPYKVETQNNQLVLTSEVDPKTGYQFSKTYLPAGKNAIAVTYRIYNRGKVEKRVGALEVTRVPPAGDVLFPLGDTAPVSGIFYPLPVSLEQGLCWFQYDGKKIRDDHHKIMLDGKEGWVAYRNKGYLLIKEFEDLPPNVIAEGEREIEVFAHVEHTFIEIKQQSAVETLAPGEFLTWTVVWHALKLPPELHGEIAPEQLADVVRLELMRPK
ncbi:hypothetical protein CJA_1442 [Cellvibrio japonicus Ueda107]|uniref:DUF4380 domain-containing protein n=3 Tax=Cellvibrio japonicus TaxID=155077 RepID=B3PDI4_CELJU|nr:hypothetical protein CJA_1442 [Cellvibrio japonicus Ueda107]